MNILEKDIEDLLFEGLTGGTDLLEQKGLSLYYDHYLRQPQLGTYGRPDIVGYSVDLKKNGERHINICILEIKKDEIDLNTLYQVCRYQAGIKHLLLKANLKNCHFVFDLISHRKVCRRGF